MMNNNDIPCNIRFNDQILCKLISNAFEYHTKPQMFYKKWSLLQDNLTNWQFHKLMLENTTKHFSRSCCINPSILKDEQSAVTQSVSWQRICKNLTQLKNVNHHFCCWLSRFHDDFHRWPISVLLFSIFRIACIKMEISPVLPECDWKTRFDIKFLKHQYFDDAL